MLEQAEDATARRVLIKALRLADISDMKEDELADVIEDRVRRLQSPDRNLRWERVSAVRSARRTIRRETPSSRSFLRLRLPS